MIALTDATTALLRKRLLKAYPRMPEHEISETIQRILKIFDDKTFIYDNMKSDDRAFLYQMETISVVYTMRVNFRMLTFYNFTDEHLLNLIQTSKEHVFIWYIDENLLPLVSKKGIKKESSLVEDDDDLPDNSEIKDMPDRYDEQNQW